LASALARLRKGPRLKPNRGARRHRLPYGGALPACLPCAVVCVRL
jgi:hypothetical protein